MAAVRVLPVDVDEGTAVAHVLMADVGVLMADVGEGVPDVACFGWT